MISASKLDNADSERPITMQKKQKSEEAVCCVREELERTMALLHPDDHKVENHHDDHHDWLGEEPEAEAEPIVVQPLHPNMWNIFNGTLMKGKAVHHPREHVTKNDHHGLLSQAYAWM